MLCSYCIEVGFKGRFREIEISNDVSGPCFCSEVFLFCSAPSSAFFFFFLKKKQFETIKYDLFNKKKDIADYTLQ